MFTSLSVLNIFASKSLQLMFAHNIFHTKVFATRFEQNIIAFQFSHQIFALETYLKQSSMENLL